VPVPAPDPAETALAVAPAATALRDVAPYAPLSLDEVRDLASTRPFDPTRAREDVRRLLATGILGTLIATIVGIFVLVAVMTPRDLSAIIQTVFPALIGITGTVMGFYFGSHQGSAGGPR
jgi:hypothetical protein